MIAVLGSELEAIEDILKKKMNLNVLRNEIKIVK